MTHFYKLSSLLKYRNFSFIGNFKYSVNSHPLNTNMGMPLVEVVKKLKEYAPLDLAEPWDNVGLLIEPSEGATVNTVLLTIDLTEDVVDEAIENKARLIISYHPNIFKPLKAISQG